jgi:hypothetical protein
MYKVHSPEEVTHLRHLHKKKNILVRFMMNGCPGCIYSQNDWDNACKKATLSPDDAILELESSFVEDFKNTMRDRIEINVYKFPTILLIRGKSVNELPNRDTASILKMLKSTKKTKRGGKRRKTKRK